MRKGGEDGQKGRGGTLRRSGEEKRKERAEGQERKMCS